jgi:aldehyde:ferredoxin oxidoreductase
VDLEPLLDAYYRFRGWDDQGRPTLNTLQRLNLEPLAAEMGIK